ncbi:MAG: SDR family NAD(P)-dependent oxidoreductase [Ktedonobacterales bacterium]|nr:SDR family NAD(P)-dependent oxidoreductase [Ktedonobacterales bacterium]
MAKEQDARKLGALIIGASSGIGAALARRLARQGYRVALLARRQRPLDALAEELNTGAEGAPVAFIYTHDVAAYEEAPALFARILADVAPLRLVIYAAGIMPHGATGATFADERAILETNTIGAMRWFGLAAVAFEREHGGTIVGISSVAGDRGRPGNGAYMASKAVLSSYVESLRYQLKPEGVRVVTVKPGYVATPMTAGLRLPRPLTITADDAARHIARAAERGLAVAYVPGYWRGIMWTVRRLPASMIARLPG